MTKLEPHVEITYMDDEHPKEARQASEVIMGIIDQMIETQNFGQPGDSSLHVAYESPWCWEIVTGVEHGEDGDWRWWYLLRDGIVVASDGAPVHDGNPAEEDSIREARRFAYQMYRGDGVKLPEGAVPRPLNISGRVA